MTDQVEGNPLQRDIFTILLALGIVVLVFRGKKVVTLLQMNLPILLFFSYCAASTLWSDFPDIAFKRWIKALGDLVMVMIILSDAERTYAIKRVLARLGFFLLPVSVLLFKYYPELGVGYKSANGGRVFGGVTNDKNMLGVLCLLTGLATVWRLLQALRERRSNGTNRKLAAHGLMLLTVFWVFLRANSMTSFVGFLMGSALIVATGFQTLRRSRFVVHVFVAVMVAIASLALFPGLGGSLVKALGRDPTLTGRTELWSEIIPMNGNSLCGSGFESFWMGSRLERIWSMHWWHPNEAHNGYLEVYLNLGWIGVFLLALVIFTGYRNSLALLRRDPDPGRLMLAFFVVGIIYSLSEAGFRLLNPMWICFMLASFAVPKSPVPAASGQSNSTLADVTPNEDIGRREPDLVGSF